MADNKAAGVYVRISQDKVGAGLGVERQQADCEELAARLGWDVVDVYCDNDLSAYSGKPRPAYQRLLADIEAGRITAVVAWHTDRLHRSPAELEGYISVCEPRDVPTHTVRAGALDLTTASGRMTARITGAVARHESEQKGERISRQKQQALAQGRRIGGRRPFGYEDDGLTPRPTEAELLETAARKIVAGDSVRSIVREWNNAGVSTSGGNRWTTSGVRQALLKPRNAGLSASKGKIYGVAQWPAVINPDVWHAMRAVLEDPSRKKHKGVSRRLLGSFLYRCGKPRCTHPVASCGNNPNGRPRYACPEMHLTRTADRIDEFVLTVAGKILDKERGNLIPPAPDVTPLRDKLEALRTRADEIAGMLADPDSGMTAEQFKISNKRVQQDIAALRQQIASREAGTVLAGIADAPKPSAAFRDQDIDRQRAVVDILMTVTLLPVGSGARFHPDSVRLAPKPVGP